MIPLRLLAVAATATLLPFGAAPPAGAADRAGALRTALERDGFVVQPGQTPAANAIELVDSGILASASGNNAGQRYKRLDVPGAPGPDGAPGSPPSGVFGLGPTEAVVWAGRTPPRSDYFSFTPFLWVRKAGSVQPAGDWVFASVGDPLNSARIATEGRRRPFGATTVVVFTPDRGTYRRVARAARAAGYAGAAVNRYVIPSSVLRLGTAPDSDSLVILVRTANFDNARAGRRYLASDRYASVFRVTPANAAAPDAYPQPAARRRLAVPEWRLVPGIRRALRRLGRAIVARRPNATTHAYGSARWFADSRAVLAAGPASPLYHRFVAGESSDTPYLRTARRGTPATFPLDAGDEVVVYGVNHAATGLATYANLAVYGEWQWSTCDGTGPQFTFGCGLPIWNGVAAMTNHQFTGSARRYLPRHPLARYLYAVTLRRGACPRTEHWCLSVPQPSRPGSADGIPLGFPTMVGYRAYVNPRTKAGPAYRDMVRDRALWFRRH